MKVHSRNRAIVSMTLTPKEGEEISEAACVAGVRPTTFCRLAALRAARSGELGDVALKVNQVKQ